MSCGKTAYIVLLVLLVFSFTGSAQVQEEPTICPIVALDNAGGADLTAYLLGGWSKNGWLDDHGTSSLLRGGERYRFYSLNGELGAALGGPPHPLGQEGDPCHDTLVVSFANSPQSRGGWWR